MKTVNLRYERAKELFRYDPKTGKLYWKKRTSHRINVGDEVGNVMGRGKKRYAQTSVDGSKMLVHRIIWLLKTGEMPSLEIGHEDGNGLNNRFENLSDVTSTENNQNLSKRSDNTSGFTGVTFHKGAQKWLVQMQLNGKFVYGGLHLTLNAAIKARKKLNKLHGFHPNHGMR